jgi:DNA (cytosine-5)-methyltransferase 1
MNTDTTITLGSLFDGIGGFPYAASLFGVKPLWASEILPQAISVTRRHFPRMEHAGDITTLDGAVLAPVDIITFGSPCQDLSVAGRRAGLKGVRSGLFTEAIRVIDEMREETNGRYPSYAVWENVLGALSSGQPRGADFAFVLEALTKSTIPIPRSGRWANAGMVRGNRACVAWRVLDAQYHGVAQRRRRIFLVADFGGRGAGKILFVEKSLRGHPAPGTKARKGAACDAARGACGATGTDHLMAFVANQRDEARLLGDLTGALCAQPNMKQQTFVAERCLNPWDTQQARVSTQGAVAPTLSGSDGGGGRNPAGLVLVPSSDEHDVAVTVPPALSMRLRKGCKGGGKGPLVQAERSDVLSTRTDQYLFAPNLTSGDPHFVATVFNRQRFELFKEQGITSTQAASQCKGATDIVCTGASGTGHKEPAHAGYIVRRLTPTECERLQGLPDGWTRLGAGGEEISDMRRYQMLGNSLAIPCAAFVLGNIASQIHGGAVRGWGRWKRSATE